MTPPAVLHISNEPVLGPGARFVQAFAALAAEGHLTHTVVSPRAECVRGASPEDALRRTCATAQAVMPDVVFVQTPGLPTWDGTHVRALLGVLRSPTVVYWEGDSWGGRRTPTTSARAWLRHSDLVFTVALGHQHALLSALTPGRVEYVPNVLPLSMAAPLPSGEPTTDVAVVGNRYLRFGWLERIEGNRDRARMTRGLQRIPGCRTAVYGSGWRGPGARGPLPFDEQITALRQARITAGWNHYNRHWGSFSDRLPIALYAGRPHVTSRQPGLDWLPGPDHGLYLTDTPRAAVDLVRALLDEDPAPLAAAGARGSAWVRQRLTDREALLHMLGGLMPMPRPPADPWAGFARYEAPARVGEGAG